MPTVSYTSWILDAPGCVSFREMELDESGERRMTKKALRVTNTTKIADIDARLQKTVPVDIGDAMHQLHCNSVVVGDKHSFEAFVADKPVPAKLVADVSEWTKEKGLAEFSTDHLGNLYVEDLPGAHELKIDGSGVGKGRKVRVFPGWILDLSGTGSELLFEVWRDTHAHA